MDGVLLTTLKLRTSVKGNEYLSGYLGKARVVGFKDREAPDGETHWNLFVQTIEQKQDRPERPTRQRSFNSPALPAGHLDDDLSDLGR